MAAKDSTAIEQVSILFQMDIDDQMQKKSEKATNNMISLISDLAIIGTVAGKALGKMWDGLQNTINASLKQFDDISLGLTVGIDPEDLGALQYAVGQIGGNNQDVNKMLKSLDAKRLSFTDTATGADELESTIKSLAVYDVPEDQGQAIQDALVDGDLVEVIKLVGDLRNALGDNFSNFASALGLEGLANLELDFKYENWIAAWDKGAMRINEVNLKGLSDLETGYADIKSSMDGLSKWLGASMGGSLSELGDAVLKLTNKFLTWTDTIVADPKAKDLLDSTMKVLSPNKDFINGDINVFEAMWQGLKDGGALFDNFMNYVRPTPGADDKMYDPRNFDSTLPGSDMSFFPKAQEGITILGDVHITADNVSQIETELLGVGRTH